MGCGEFILKTPLAGQISLYGPLGSHLLEFLRFRSFLLQERRYAHCQNLIAHHPFLLEDYHSCGEREAEERREERKEV